MSRRTLSTLGNLVSERHWEAVTSSLMIFIPAILTARLVLQKSVTPFCIQSNLIRADMPFHEDL